MGRARLDPSRSLTEQERAWLVQGLKTLASGEYFGGERWVDLASRKVKPLDDPIDPSYWLTQLDSLLVVGQCDCGERNCHTVQFEDFGTGPVIAMVSSGTDDDRMLNIFINEQTGRLVEMEII